MYLSKEEERIYEGEAGWVLEKAIKVVIKVGEAMGADRLIPISHAHISGVGYGNIGEAGLSLLRDLRDGGARFNVYTTANPGSVDDDSSYYFNYGTPFIQGQREILSIFKEMGVNAFTCTPYYYREPRAGEILAWAESNAVLIANSIYGARSNRESGLLALFEAILGKAYRAGLLVDENRKPQILVNIEARVRSIIDYGLVGLLVGEMVGERIPYVVGLKPQSHEEVKAFLAAAGSSGGMGLVMIDRLSPDAIGIEGSLNNIERISIDDKDLRRVSEDAICNEVDAALIGCPHASVELIEDLARLIVEKNVSATKPVWVFTSHHVYEELSRKGLIDLLISRGVKVFTGICGVISPLNTLGYRCIATPSAKAAFYLPRLARVRYVYMDLPGIVASMFK
ncbi:hypothetical protein ATG_00070 [Desulfurococcaceae archaeon AG1]|jgi:predicted aconitase|nr:hypothetical protein ATG_00070 [Desulfurococcaceae archaeon AG1]